jgi:hypothetical protein
MASKFSKLGKFYAEVETINTMTASPWILFGAAVQGTYKYFKEITIYFLRWEFTFGYNWEGWEGWDEDDKDQ